MLMLRAAFAAGLIISEGAAISRHAPDYPTAPGIYTKAPIIGWRAVTHSVHERSGGLLCSCAQQEELRLIAVAGGRTARRALSNSANYSALKKDFQMGTAEIPSAMKVSEFRVTLSTFRKAALNAMEAAFDGVKWQGADGHLIEQFFGERTQPAERGIRWDETEPGPVSVGHRRRSCDGY
jgi:N-ethylmaleimide reductase